MFLFPLYSDKFSGESHNWGTGQKDKTYQKKGEESYMTSNLAVSADTMSAVHLVHTWRNTHTLTKTCAYHGLDKKLQSNANQKHKLQQPALSYVRYNNVSELKKKNNKLTGMVSLQTHM